MSVEPKAEVKDDFERVQIEWSGSSSGSESFNVSASTTKEHMKPHTWGPKVPTQAIVDFYSDVVGTHARTGSRSVNVL